MRLKKSGWMVIEDIVVRICGETEALTMNMTFSKLGDRERQGSLACCKEGFQRVRHN